MKAKRSTTVDDPQWKRDYMRKTKQELVHELELENKRYTREFQRVMELGTDNSRLKNELAERDRIIAGLLETMGGTKAVLDGMQQFVAGTYQALNAKGREL